MNLMKMLRNAALALTMLTAGVANATVLQFTVTGGYSASWQLDTEFGPDAYAVGAAFAYYDIPGFPDAFFGVADLYFYNSDFFGGLEIDDYYGGTTLLLTDGPQLYTGSEDNPLFLLGSFALTDSGGTGTYTLTIAEVGAPVDVPEPASGLLLLGGLALMGSLRISRSRL